MLGAALWLTACTGLFDDIYDDPADQPLPTPEVETDSTETTISGTLYIDASDWEQWYYVDLQALADSVLQGQGTGTAVVCSAIPMTATGHEDHRSGIYTYWYDVFGAGISVNEFRTFEPTDVQPEPDRWSFAVHRNNVRTNGGAACATDLTDIARLSMSRDELGRLAYTPDEWSENQVWTIQTQMLNSLIGSQGITVNPVLSSWLKVDLPPIPPSFTLNNHVFILRLADGRYAALQLVNHQNAAGKKCHLTIQYKYPL